MELDFYNALMVFMRVSSFLLVQPFFSAVNFPVRLRMALGAFIAFLIAPTLPPFAMNHMDFMSLVGAMAQEVGIGLLLGYLSRVVFYAVDLAGNIVSTELGLNMGAIMNPLTHQQSPIPGSILFFLAAIVMLTMDLHHWMLLGFVHTYTVLPIGGAHLNTMLFDTIVGETNRIFSVALQISAPIMAVSFVVTLVFAVLSRAVPQMNVFVLSFSFRIVGGLAVFGFTLQLASQHVLNFLNRLPDDLLNLANLLALR